ncbi:MAG: hypothetical protein KKH99_07445, partial [Proteobacteria bacterium]|nr:hypothetical protein [Pseudomonadota bacterium]
MKKHIGWIVVSTLVLYLLSLRVPFMLGASTLSAWLVLPLMWRTLGKGACNQALVLIIIGSIFLLFSAFNGIFLGWQQILAANVPLLAMFVAVSFLGMTSTGIED